MAEAVPSRFDRPALEDARFAGWRTWAQLRASAFAEVPEAPGAYVVWRATTCPPAWRETSPAGRFKGQDPTVAPALLQRKWVEGGQVLYIGKADVLRRRLEQYARFGAGEPVGHWGGRVIWQLADADDLLVAWRALAASARGGVPGDAREYERQLLVRFAELHDGHRPFANLVR